MICKEIYRNKLHVPTFDHGPSTNEFSRCILKEFFHRETVGVWRASPHSDDSFFFWKIFSSLILKFVFGAHQSGVSRFSTSGCQIVGRGFFRLVAPSPQQWSHSRHPVSKPPRIHRRLRRQKLRLPGTSRRGGPRECTAGIMRR